MKENSIPRIFHHKTRGSHVARSQHRHDDGISLVEVLTVVVILVALAAIAFPVYVNQRKQAEVSSVAANLSQIANVVGAAITSREGDLSEDSGYIAGSEGSILDGGFGGKVPIRSGYSVMWNSIEKVWCVEGFEGGSGYYHYDEIGGPKEGNCPFEIE